LVAKPEVWNSATQAEQIAIYASTGWLATNPPLFPGRLQLPVAFRVDVLLAPRQHVLANVRQPPLIFKWRHFEPQIILCAVRWYLRFSPSYRDVPELLAERGLPVDPSTIWRWVQRFAPELCRRLPPHLKPINRSWRVDETYVRVTGQWCYLYRAIDSRGATIEFFLSAFRDLDAAKSLFRRALRDGAHRQPRVIHTDWAPTYPSAIGVIAHK
jgi:IS6 family transposase